MQSYKVVICTFVKNVTQVTLIRNTPHRCLQLMLMSRLNMLSLNIFINTIGKHPISLVCCVAIFSTSRLTLIKAINRQLTKEKVVQLGFV